MDAIWSDLLRQRYIRLLPLLTRNAITRSSFCRSDFRRDRNRRFYLWTEECLVAANGHRARADRVSVFCFRDLAALCDRPGSVWRTVHLARLGNDGWLHNSTPAEVRRSDPVGLFYAFKGQGGIPVDRIAMADARQILLSQADPGGQPRRWFAAVLVGAALWMGAMPLPQLRAAELRESEVPQPLRSCVPLVLQDHET